MRRTIGTPNSASPTVDGTVRNSTIRNPRRRVARRLSQSPEAASRDRWVSAVVPTATPNTPIGSCINRNAYDSHEIAPSDTRLANDELTTTLICTAATPSVAGAIKVAIRRVPGSRRRRSGVNRGRNPVRHSVGTWIASCATPPTSTNAAQLMTAIRDDGAMKYTAIPPAIATRLNIDDASAGVVYFSSALSAPIAT